MKLTRVLSSISSCSARTLLVFVPATAYVVLSMLLLAYFYMSGVGRQADYQRARLADLLSHLSAGMNRDQSLETISAQMESFGRSTPQADGFRLHLFLLSGSKVIASTDHSALGKTYDQDSWLFKGFFERSGETSVSVSRPMGDGLNLVAHEDITGSIARIRNDILKLAIVCLVVITLLTFGNILLFRQMISIPIRSISDLLTSFTPDFLKSGTNPEVPVEFLPLLKAWDEKLHHLGAGAQTLIHAERKGSIVLLTNAFRHSLSRISDLMGPIALLPARVLTASQISSLHQAKELVDSVHQRLDEMDMNSDPLNLCQKMLGSDDTELN